MQGFQLSFHTTQDHRHGGLPLAEWLLQEARRMGFGATLLAASEGVGRHGHLHSAHFVELADQPQEVILALGVADAERFMAHLAAEQIRVFYVKTPIEYGMTGE